MTKLVFSFRLNDFGQKKCCSNQTVGQENDKTNIYSEKNCWPKLNFWPNKFEKTNDFLANQKMLVCSVSAESHQKVKINASESPHIVLRKSS